MLKDTDYMYATALINSAGGKKTPKERLDTFLESKSVDSLKETAADLWNININREATLDEVLDSALTDAVYLVRDNVPSPDIFDSLLYKYDCCNIKSAIKNKIRTISDKSIYFSCGTVPVFKIEDMVRTEDYSGMPDAMAKGAMEAIEAYTKTGEARVIDLLIDKACFEDIKHSAEKSGVGLLKTCAVIRSDSVNIMTAQRINRQHMEPDIAKNLFTRSFVTGGELSLSDFLTDEGGLKGISELGGTIGEYRLKETVRELGNRTFTMSEAEKAFTESYLAYARKYGDVAFGAEVPALYIITRETEIKNCKIIASALAKNIDLNEIVKEVYLY